MNGGENWLDKLKFQILLKIFVWKEFLISPPPRFKKKIKREIFYLSEKPSKYFSKMAPLFTAFLFKKFYIRIFYISLSQIFISKKGEISGAEMSCSNLFK
jgi:hypothetical protein